MNATQYIRRIKNPVKRCYAEQCLAAKLSGQPYPERPSELSYMAAQAVRMQLDDLEAKED